MKTLILVRHAKSSWDDISLKDIDRPLKASGAQDAYLMADFLSSKGLRPEIIISSPAVRAISTALIFCAQIKIPYNRIKIDSRIYESSPGEIKAAIASIESMADTIMVFGHDPSLSGLYTNLTQQQVSKIPTSGVAAISIDIKNWSEVLSAAGKSELFLKPKEIRNLLSKSS